MTHWSLLLSPLVAAVMGLGDLCNTCLILFPPSLCCLEKGEV